MSACVCGSYSCDGECGDVHLCIRCDERFHDPDGPHRSACPECDHEPICPDCDEDQLMACDECGDAYCREHLHELVVRTRPYVEVAYLCARDYEHRTGKAA